jgi:hypothetical protein
MIVSSRGLAWILGALVALAYASILLGGQTFADASWLGHVAPARHAAGDAIARGELPAWWPESGLGAPLLAEGAHGALYPPAWIAAFGDAALDAIAILHLWLLAIGTALLAGRLGADAPGKLLAGAAAALAAASAGALVGGALFSLAWAPFAAERAFALCDAPARHARIRAALAIAACLAMAGLGGAPLVKDATIVTVLVIGAARGGLRGFGWCAAAAFGSLALCAVQLAPALIHIVSGHAVGPLHPTPGITLVELVAPGTTGVSGALLGGGAAVIALAALSRSRWLAWPIVLLVAAAAGIVPPALVWVWLAALAGTGLTTLTETPPERPTWIAAATTVGALATALAACAVLRNSIAASVDRVGLDGVTLVEHAIRRGLIAVGFAAAAVALALVAAQRRQTALAALAGLLALVEIMLANRAAVPRRPRNEQPALVAALAQVAPARVFRNIAVAAAADDRANRATSTLSDDAATALAHAADESVAPLGIAAVPGHDAARLALQDRMPAATASVAARYLDRYSVPYAVVPSTVVAASGMREIAAGRDESLVAVEPRRPRAFWTTRWRHVSDADALTALAPPPGATAEPLGSVLLAGSGDAGGDDIAAPRPCAITRPTDAEVRLACNVTAPGYAVLLDAWAPGWSATVDGHDAPLERADLVTRAVRVAPGARTIVFRYSPPGFWLGAAISALALLNVVLLLWLTRSTTARSGRAAPA